MSTFKLQYFRNRQRLFDAIFGNSNLNIRPLTENNSNSYFTHVCILNCKTEEVIGSCYTGDPISGNYIHMYIATCHIEGH